jgi:hypothetical protein
MGLYGQGDAPGSAGNGGPVITAVVEGHVDRNRQLAGGRVGGFGRCAVLISSGWQGGGGSCRLRKRS